jgi:hypothetical protein
MLTNANSMHAGMKNQMTFEQANRTQIGYDVYEKIMISAKIISIIKNPRSIPLVI